MEHSESLKELATALSKAQGEIENAHKNAANTHFKAKYADLAEIINTVRPVLTKYGLAVVQIPGFADGVVTVETMLTHASGEWIKGTSGAPAQKQDPQGVGSAVTYLRRYSLAAVCAIAQEDDDGEAAVERNGKPARREKAPKPEPQPSPLPELRDTIGGLCAAFVGVELTEQERKLIVKASAVASDYKAPAAWLEEAVAKLTALAKQKGIQATQLAGV